MFIYINDNAPINQWLAPLDVGHAVYTAAKVHIFVICEPVSVANSWQNFPASPAAEEKSTAPVGGNFYFCDLLEL